MWERKGVALHIRDMGGSAIDTCSAIGRMFLTMLAGFAEFERNQTSERIRSAMTLKKSKHEYTGGRVPYGFRLSGDGRTLEVDDMEREAIRLALDLQSVQGLSLRKICAVLTAQGYRPRSSSTWRASSLHEILKAAAA